MSSTIPSLLLLVLTVSTVVYSASNCTGSSCRQLDVQVLLPYNHPFSDCALPALVLAVDYISANVPIKNYVLNQQSVELGDTTCDGSRAVGLAADGRIKEKVNVQIGVPCTNAAKSTAELLSYLKRPLLSWYAPDIELKDKNKIKTLIRIFPPVHKAVQPILKILEKFDWQQIGVIYGDDKRSSDLWSVLEDEILTNSSIRIRHKEECRLSQAQNCLLNLKDKVRIILLLVASENLHSCMQEANAIGMGDKSDYVIIHYHWLSGMKSIRDLWYGPAGVQWSNLLTISLKVGPESGTSGYNTFQKFIDELFTIPYYHTCNASSSALTMILAGYAYDTLVYYALARQYLEKHSLSWEEFLSWAPSVTGLHTKGKTGYLKFDDKGDRIGTYSVKHYQRDTWVEIAEIESENNSVVILHNSLFWNDQMKIPPDVPDCGFGNEKCTETLSSAMIAGICVPILVIAAVAVAVGLHCYKKQKFEREVMERAWVVSTEDIKMTKGSTSERQTPITGDRRSLTGTIRKRLMRMATRGNVMNPLGSLISFDQLSMANANIAVYKDQLVIVKRLSRQLKTDRETLEDLKTLYEMKADNVNSFIGATIDEDPVILMGFCSKGSLRDVLDDKHMKLDSMFVLSFLSDISRGMQFLHRSQISSHGNLKSANCVLDSRWVLKVTDPGLLVGASRIFQTNTESGVPSEDDYYEGLLWTAPELLRMTRRPAKGTPQGDIYSFAIILQEVISRKKAYQYNVEFSDNSYKDIITMVKEGKSSGVVCRPLVFEEAQDAYPACTKWRQHCSTLIKLMRQCWSEDPDQRPTFDMTKRYIKNMHPGGKMQLVDHMLAMMEKYTDNLEELVEEKTDELAQEQLKTENLLNSMLPREVANRLKRGEPVEPQSFAAVSIFFSDIVGFTTIASKSQPLQIVNMLNKLYTLFDEIIGSYQVYKVETIGDAYMVASGLPVKIDFHASEIACMALDFLEAVKGFVIDHMPDTHLKLRIGLHLGPCVAGVVGIAMPRYCLFGDTVNMASRMESTGEALKIHCSSAIHRELLRTKSFITEMRGEIDVKGKGKQITYWLIRRIGNVEGLRGSGNVMSADIMDDVKPSDSISNTGRASDIGETASAAESRDTWLELPDQSPLYDPMRSESIRSIGDIQVDRRSSRASSAGSGYESINPNGSQSPTSQLKLLTEETPNKFRKSPKRRPSLQLLHKTALIQRAARIRRHSQGKIGPMLRAQTLPEFQADQNMELENMSKGSSPNAESMFITLPANQHLYSRSLSEQRSPDINRNHLHSLNKPRSNSLHPTTLSQGLTPVNEGQRANSADDARRMSSPAAIRSHAETLPGNRPVNKRKQPIIASHLKDVPAAAFRKRGSVSFDDSTEVPDILIHAMQSEEEDQEFDV